MVLGNLVFIIWMFPWIYFVIIISVPVLGGLHELMDLLKTNSSQERRQLPQLSLLNLQSIIYIFATVLTLFMPFITSDNQDWQLPSTFGTLGYAVWGLWLGIYLLSCASITRQEPRNEKSSLGRGVDKGLELIAGMSLVGGVVTYLMGSGYSLYLLNFFYQGEGEYSIKKSLESFSWGLFGMALLAILLRMVSKWLIKQVNYSSHNQSTFYGSIFGTIFIFVGFAYGLIWYDANITRAYISINYDVNLQDIELQDLEKIHKDTGIMRIGPTSDLLIRYKADTGQDWQVWAEVEYEEYENYSWQNRIKKDLQSTNQEVYEYSQNQGFSNITIYQIERDALFFDRAAHRFEHNYKDNSEVTRTSLYRKL